MNWMVLPNQVCLIVKLYNNRPGLLPDSNDTTNVATIERITLHCPRKLSRDNPVFEDKSLLEESVRRCRMTDGRYIARKESLILSTIFLKVY